MENVNQILTFRLCMMYYSLTSAMSHCNVRLLGVSPVAEFVPTHILAAPMAALLDNSPGAISASSNDFKALRSSGAPRARAMHNSSCLRHASMGEGAPCFPSLLYCHVLDSASAFGCASTDVFITLV